MEYQLTVMVDDGTNQAWQNWAEIPIYIDTRGMKGINALTDCIDKFIQDMAVDKRPFRIRISADIPLQGDTGK